MKTLFLLLFAMSGTVSLKSQQLVYKPINPAFGGDTFNYQWLLSSANAQNQFDDDKSGFNSLLDGLNSMDSFTDSLNRQILSQLSQKLFDDQFGDGKLQPGNYMFGSLYLEITQSSQGLLISILDTSNGQQSEIVIPR